ncbi:MAG: hypothetical protein ACOYYJ_10225 [Chloroflexota bacterium]
MKKTILITLAALVVSSLVACAGNAGQATPETDGLPIASQLIVGTFRLEDTELAVTPEQATDLLVLWRVYVDLGESDTAAQVEMDALVEQVQESMTTEQVSAILDMQITQQDVFAVLVEQGGAGSSAGAGDGDTSAASGGGGGFAPPDGGMAGSPPDGGGGAPPDGEMMPDGGAGGTASAGQGAETGPGAGPAGSAGVPTALVEALIRLLEQKVNS